VSEAPDPMRVAASFRAHGVDYVLVGGVAEAVHGVSAGTDDIDIVLPSDDANIARVGLALMDLGARPIAETSADEHRTSFVTVAGRLDLIEDEGFAEIASRAAEADLGNGVHARVAAIEDLARLKRDSGHLADSARLTTMVARPVEPETVIHLEDESAVYPEDRVHEKPKRTDKIWRALERVDDFLTDLDSRGPRRKRGS